MTTTNYVLTICNVLFIFTLTEIGQMTNLRGSMWTRLQVTNKTLENGYNEYSQDFLPFIIKGIIPMLKY